MIVLKIFSVAVGIALLFLDIRLLIIALGYRRHLCGKCKGYLKETKQLHNVYRGGKHGRFYKNYIDYAYVYRVNGKEYFITDSKSGTKNNLRYTVDIVYQKKHPNRAYIDGLYFNFEASVALLLCPVWIIFIVCGIFM